MKKAKLRLVGKRSGKRPVKPPPLGDSWTLDSPLPCDVRLCPSIGLPRGSRLRTLLTAMRAIELTRNGQNE
jgi:hypothetical protein